MKLSIAFLFLAFQILTACKTISTEDHSAAEVWGFKEKENVRKVILSHKKELNPCFEAYMKKHPKVVETDIKFTMAWTIGTDGLPKKFSQDGSKTWDPALFKCVSEGMKTWVFPIPPNDIVSEVEFPFYYIKGEVRSSDEANL